MAHQKAKSYKYIRTLGKQSRCRGSSWNPSANLVVLTGRKNGAGFRRLGRPPRRSILRRSLNDYVVKLECIELLYYKYDLRSLRLSFTSICFLARKQKF